MSLQSRFNAQSWILGAGALGRPRGIVRGGRRVQDGEHMSLSILVSSVCMPGSGMAGSYGSSSASFATERFYSDNTANTTNLYIKKVVPADTALYLCALERHKENTA